MIIGAQSSVVLAAAGSFAITQKLTKKQGSTLAEAKIIGCGSIVTCLAAQVEVVVGKRAAHTDVAVALAHSPAVVVAESPAYWEMVVARSQLPAVAQTPVVANGPTNQLTSN